MKEGEEITNLPQNAWGETETRLPRAIYRWNNISRCRSELYRTLRPLQNLVVLWTPLDGRGGVAETEKTRLKEGLRVGKILGSGARVLSQIGA